MNTFATRTSMQGALATRKVASTAPLQSRAPRLAVSRRYQVGGNTMILIEFLLKINIELFLIHALQVSVTAFFGGSRNDGNGQQFQQKGNSFYPDVYQQRK
jgi:hypothetical protein